MASKTKYPTDTERGVRTITQINNCPAGQLNDEEFVKAFFDRFKAQNMIMVYVDDQNEYHSFGRSLKAAKYRAYYRSLMKRLEFVFDPNKTDTSEI